MSKLDINKNYINLNLSREKERERKKIHFSYYML